MSSVFRGHSKRVLPNVSGYLPMKKYSECQFHKVRMFVLNDQNSLCTVRFKVVGHSPIKHRSLA